MIEFRDGELTSGAIIRTPADSRDILHWLRAIAANPHRTPLWRAACARHAEEIEGALTAYDRENGL